MRVSEPPFSDHWSDVFELGILLSIAITPRKAKDFHDHFKFSLEFFDYAPQP
jgi:hypothetical protein